MLKLENIMHNISQQHQALAGIIMLQVPAASPV
jgi:hypothetical protein